jgi:hypothetical protein
MGGAADGAPFSLLPVTTTTTTATIAENSLFTFLGELQQDSPTDTLGATQSRERESTGEVTFSGRESWHVSLWIFGNDVNQYIYERQEMSSSLLLSTVGVSLYIHTYIC